ncbi:MAG: Verru Chthon cassette protein, partial [Verrucomicrobiaceae bacterium]|nr:Verru Chthon cassette protein [Verrucomicrobiaceae bacterium]
MKTRFNNNGGALVELLVSLGVAGLLLVFLVQVLGGVQRSWMTARRVTHREETAHQSLTVLSEIVGTAILNPRQKFDAPAHPAQWVKDSDLHFVCGPSSELLAGMPHVCGDALFFQRLNSDGLIESCGFYVQFGSDGADSPEALRSSLESRQRFRLMLFHEPAKELTLFQSSAGAGGPPLLSALTLREDLYAWFKRPLMAGKASRTHTAVVADNVLALLVRKAPDDQRCYDTRRHQWEGSSPESARSRHQLPQSLEITLIT